METQTSLLESLRLGVQDLHAEAEAIPFARALLGGTLPREAYFAFLAQRLHLHHALDRAWEMLIEDRPELRQAIAPQTMQSGYLVEDLAFFRLEHTLPPAFEATEKAIAEIHENESGRPLFLVGHFYVHEGSKNGGRFLARAVRRALALPPDQGTRYLDPYGEAQRELWAERKVALEAIPWDAAARRAIIEGARQAFRQTLNIDLKLFA